MAAPSDADMQFTRRTASAAALVGVELVDHLVLGAIGPGESGVFRPEAWPDRRQSLHAEFAGSPRMPEMW